MSRKNLNDELAALEAALASLVPKRSGLDHDRVMFLAGRASAAKSSVAAKPPGASWLWPCLTAASLLLAVTFGSMLLTRGGPPIADRQKSPGSSQPQPLIQRQEEVQIAVAPQELRPARKIIRADYLKLRRVVLSEGVEALPSPKPRSTPREQVPLWTPGRIDGLESILDG